MDWPEEQDVQNPSQPMSEDEVISQSPIRTNQNETKSFESLAMHFISPVQIDRSEIKSANLLNRNSFEALNERVNEEISSAIKIRRLKSKQKLVLAPSEFNEVEEFTETSPVKVDKHPTSRSSRFVSNLEQIVQKQ